MSRVFIPVRPTLFWLICGALFLVAFLIESLNGKLLLNDFKVYYEASGLYFNHGNPYSQAFGLSSGFYKYSPAWLYLFGPFSLMKFSVAKNFYYLLISIAGIAAYELSANLVTREAENGFKRKNLFKTLILLTGVVHLSRELHLGNINLILILLVSASVYTVIHKHYKTAGALITLTVFLKPYFILVFVPVLIYRHWKVLIPGFVTAIILFLMPVLHSGWNWNWQLHQYWLQAMMGHQEGMFSEHTFSSIFTSYTGMPLASHWTFIFAGSLLLLYTTVRLIRYPGRRYLHKKFTTDTFIWLALLPNLFITDSEHFLYSMPLIALILGRIAMHPKWTTILIFLGLWFFYGANSNDLLGNPLSDLFDTYSTIGVANLGLVILYLFLDRTPARN